MEVEEERDDEVCEFEEEASGKQHTCHECGAEFKKPAQLKQAYAEPLARGRFICILFNSWSNGSDSATCGDRDVLGVCSALSVVLILHVIDYFQKVRRLHVID
ncbi:hypothetical protein Bca4012_057640 [Brassica carinata]